MSLEGNIKLRLDLDYKKSLDMSTPRDQLLKDIVLALTSGTGADQADKLWHDERSLAGGASENLDLSGILTDAFGDILSAAVIKFLLLYNKSTTKTFTIGGASSNAFVGPFGASTHTLSLKPSTANNYSWVVPIADPNGFQVTAGTADQLKVANEAGDAAIYGIVIVATSA